MDLVHMGTSAPSIFQNFENFKISHFYVFKNYDVKYIDRYIHEECTQKVPLKIRYILGNMKKTNFWEQIIVQQYIFLS
jgi:hypothetical protein